MSKTHRSLFLGLLLFASSQSIGQEFGRAPLEFTVNGSPLSMPLAGGLNAPQFSRANLNLDSIPDLVVFDRSGNKVLPFTGTGERAKFQYAPEFESIFPQLESWMLMRDFNGDSVVDIFSFSKTGAPGIDVYQGFIVEGQLKFEQKIFDNGIGVLGYPSSTGPVTNIYVSAIDVPAIVDVDGDGDLDILSFQSEGTQVAYYQNLVVEKDMSKDTFDFILGDRCWGKFVEAFNTNDVVLSDDPNQCPDHFAGPRGGLHSGSTVTAFDADLDGDQDLLLGDISFETLLFLVNGGSIDAAHMTAANQEFPSYDQPVDIPFFPTAFINDFDGDGTPDMIAAPNQEDARENVNVGWFYSGRIDQNGIRFTLEKRQLLVEDMLDFGTDAAPHLADFTGDGLIDLLVGSRFEEDYDNAFPSQLFLFENTGTKNDPAFTLIDENWLNLKDQVSEIDALNPTTVDLDQDGDFDLVIGNKRGKLIYIENMAVPGSGFEPGEVIYPWFEIDVGFASAPTFVDIDVDGDFDMLVGEERGNINLFRNQGNAQQPIFEADPFAEGNNEDFGAIDARQDRAVFGAASPIVFESGDTTYLTVGTSFGNFLTYDVYEPSDTLHPLSNQMNQIRDGQRSQSSIADLDSDGFLEVMAGSSRGGLVYYQTSLRLGASVPVQETSAPLQVGLFPVPASRQLNVWAESQISSVEIFDYFGRSLLQASPQQYRVQLDVAHLPVGVYLLRIQSNEKMVVRKWVKK